MKKRQSNLKPTIFIIFGGTGDLNKRKLAPALYNLYTENYMPGKFAIIGTGRTTYTNAQYREEILHSVNEFSRNGEVQKERWDVFEKNIHYISVDIEQQKTFEDLKEAIVNLQEQFGPDTQTIFYLAVAPNFFPLIAECLHKYKLTSDEEKCRIVIEKPFGHDLESAKKLNCLLSAIFTEKQIYRIDHYLGKETVQNMMAFRFANSLFEPLWNRTYIEHVQISVTEQLGVGERGGYYEDAGALRDMIQNHLLQLLCLVGMEAPISFNADEIRDRKVEVLKAMRPFKPENVSLQAVRGQYGKGWIEGKEVPGYRSEKDVDPESNTETFAAIKFFIDNWRWQGVPFYLRTGKRLNQTSSTITIQFRDVPHHIFATSSIESWQQNRLIISIQPEMSIRLQVQSKRPGLNMILNPVDMIFNYKGTYDNNTPEAYETLLLDVMTGDQTLFMRGDQVETAWELVMPIINLWENKKSLNFPNYAADSWGPEEAEALIAKDGFYWFTLPVKE
ncbi:glucose-6-phosphate dehydrogenase [Pedobacter montanisoli]|uniref:Glucose-6-phosphate 1-dehydrogenase n=1 Tax=Pedobacter montanisoli TaxID=2923277 RepID=A0ABS9ZYD9_9SPHI|nr:glucose-6-phosphate dehydrogenase [Pedobacter montanisoli]MCJ0743309.1 glucose-6-phosphate dehydrogenase [Pedobacter montanisoli]